MWTVNNQDNVMLKVWIAGKAMWLYSCWVKYSELGCDGANCMATVSHSHQVPEKCHAYKRWENIQKAHWGKFLECTEMVFFHDLKGHRLELFRLLPISDLGLEEGGNLQEPLSIIQFNPNQSQDFNTFQHTIKSILTRDVKVSRKG